MTSARPTISVVVPFAGDAAQALIVVALLRSLQIEPGDELILADNCDGVAPTTHGITVVRVVGEQSPAHARNAGAAHATGDWILFLDADVSAPVTLLDDYFREPAAARVGALVGEIEAASGGRSVAARYGEARNFLSQSAHMAHPFRPRAAAANLLVRRVAFEAAAGFVEGVRAAEDTDFTWRLQDLGWTLELRPGAVVRHEYRQTIADLRHQWRAYAAGRAWLATRYPGFHPEPAVTRALRRATGRSEPRLTPRARRGALVKAPRRSGVERAQFLALDALLAIEELIGFRRSNRATTEEPEGK